MNDKTQTVNAKFDILSNDAPRSKRFVGLRGLEPPRLATYAPQAYAYTIPPQARGHNGLHIVANI